MAQRLWTQADSSNPAVAWLNAANTNALTLSSGTTAAGGKVSAAQNAASGGGSFAQATTANQPTFNPTGSAKGKPVIQSLSGGQKLTSTNIPNLPLGTVSGMVMGVMSFTANSSYNYPGMLIYGDPSTGKTREIDAQGFSDRIYGTTFGSDGNSGISSGAVDRLVVAVYDAGKIYTWIDGVLVLTITTAFNTVAGVLRILDNGIGRFCDLLVVPGIADRQLYEGWLAWKNGIQDQLPAVHPYAASKSAPMVDDGAANPITGSSTSTLSAIGAASAAGLAIAGAASLALAGIGSTSTASARIAAQSQASLGAIVSAGAGGIAVAGAGAATLQAISASGAGTLPVLAVGTTSLGDVASSSNGSLPVAGAASSTFGPVGMVSAGRADVRGTASTSLHSILGSATAGGQSLATASSASVLGSISTASTGSVPVVGAGSTALGAIASNSGTASAVRGAGAASLGAVVSASASSIPIGAIGAANLGGVRGEGRGCALASAIASSALSGIVGAASATVGQDTDNQLVGPGWTLFATHRRFVASAIRRSFIVSSTGCKRMLNFPPKYAHEVRNAVVDFAPALSEGEGLTGQPTVAVMKGDLAVSVARIEGTAVHFSLSGGTAATKVVQWVEVHCQTDGDQVLEEVVSVTMLS